MIIDNKLNVEYADFRIFSEDIDSFLRRGWNLPPTDESCQTSFPLERLTLFFLVKIFYAFSKLVWNLPLPPITYKLANNFLLEGIDCIHLVKTYFVSNYQKSEVFWVSQVW